MRSLITGRSARRAGPAALVASAAGLLMFGSLHAQDAPAAGCGFLGGWPAPLHLDALRFRELSGAVPVAPHASIRASSRYRACQPGPDAATGLQLDLLPVQAIGQQNTEYPRESLDGLRWAGTGFSGAVRGGVTARWGPLSAAFAPAFAYHANDPFRTLDVNLPGWSAHANPWIPTIIDWPQRFGTDAFWRADAGDSYIRLDAAGAAIGFSNETLRWGPARRNPLMMSGAAPGFPHVFIGTGRPVDVWVARLSLEAVWGHLAESDYFDGNPANDRRLLAGFVATLQPRGVQGLAVGFTRSFIATIPAQGFELLDYIREPYSKVFVNEQPASGEASENQIFGFFARWVFPESAFEVYGEFIRDDHWDGFDDLLKEPEHAAGFTVGLQKLVPLDSAAAGGRTLRLAAEATNLNFSETQRSRRPEVIIYTHEHVPQGYTHRGQLLGAPIGPSSDAQSLELDLLTDGWTAGLYFERVRYLNDIYWRMFADIYTYKGHDVELTGGIRGSLLEPAPGLRVFGDVAWSGRYNRNFIPLSGLGYSTGFEHNLSVQLGASWTPASGRSAAAGGRASRPTPP